MTPYSHRAPGHAEYGVYKFSDDSDIGQVAAGTGTPSNYRFFEIQPIKWIVLNYDNGFNESSNIKDGLTVGTMNRYELLANDVLVSGVAPNDILWEHNAINKYLNSTFSNEAFSYTELQLAKQATIYNNTSDSDSNIAASGLNSNYLTSGSNPTTQSLYLLSRYEVVNSSGPYAGSNKIFRNDSDRIPLASDYAKAHYQFLNATTGKSHFWLRTTDGIGMYRVSSSGATGVFDLITNTSRGTRPAMQVVKNVRFDK